MNAFTRKQLEAEYVDKMYTAITSDLGRIEQFILERLVQDSEVLDDDTLIAFTSDIYE